MPHVLQLLSNHQIISDQITKPALAVVLNGCEDVLLQNIPGDVVEFGCYKGTTSLFLRRLLDIHNPDHTKALHVYDSFEGLPPKTTADITTVGDDFKAGELTVSKKQLLDEFRRARLAPPFVHKGWFKDMGEDDVPSVIAFAFLDGDFYESIIDSLRLVWPRLAEGGIICIDDYQREKLPGVERAVRDFFQDKSVSIRQSHNIGTIARA